MSEPSARDNFVEAMRVLVKLPGYLNAKQAAVTAFADAECDLTLSTHLHETTTHAACRTELLKEIFGE